MTLALPALGILHSPNYSSRGNARVKLIVAHDCEGSYSGSVGWFLQVRSQVSAHIVLAEDGSRATQMVDWRNKAWHARDFNAFSEGIEAAGFAAKGLGEPEWQALAAIIAFRLSVNSIPCQIANAANNWTGYCQHVDLGQAGGGHHDISTNPAVRAHFDMLVRAAYDQPMPAQWTVGFSAQKPTMPSDWQPSATVRHDLASGSLEWLQMELNALGIALTPLTVDGLDGPETRAAVRSFQRKRNLLVDGDAGPETIAALEKAAA